MTFDPTIPEAIDLLSDSQLDIQTNFNTSNLVMGVNHVNFNNGLPVGAIAADQGKHHVTTLIERQVGWGFDPVTAANEIAIYCKDLLAVSTLFMRKESNGTVIQMSAQDPIIAGSGSSFLPGGIIIKWGICNSNGAGIVNAFASAFPNNCYVVLTVGGNLGQPNNIIKPSVLNVNNFTATSPLGEVGYYIAIGN